MNHFLQKVMLSFVALALTTNVAFTAKKRPPKIVIEQEERPVRVQRTDDRPEVHAPRSEPRVPAAYAQSLTQACAYTLLNEFKKPGHPALDNPKAYFADISLKPKKILVSELTLVAQQRWPLINFSWGINTSPTARPCTAAALSPDGFSFVFGQDDGTITVSYLNSDNKWDTKIFTQEHGGHAGWVNLIVFSPDGKKFASASWDNSIKIYDFNPAEDRFDIYNFNHISQVNALAFSHNSDRLAATCDNGTVKILSLDNDRWNLSYTINLQPIRRIFSVAFSQDDERLAVFPLNEPAHIYSFNRNNNAWEFIRAFNHEPWNQEPWGNIEIANAAVFDNNSIRIVSALIEGLVIISQINLETMTWNRIHTFDRKDDERITNTPSASNLYNNANVAISPDGKTVISSSIYRPLIIYREDANAKWYISNIFPDDRELFTIAFNPNSNAFAIATRAGMKIYTPYVNMLEDLIEKIPH